VEVKMLRDSSTSGLSEVRSDIHASRSIGTFNCPYRLAGSSPYTFSHVVGKRRKAGLVLARKHQKVSTPVGKGVQKAA
jgi:hypothetical protein